MKELIDNHFTRVNLTIISCRYGTFYDQHTLPNNKEHCQKIRALIFKNEASYDDFFLIISV